MLNNINKFSTMEMLHYYSNVFDKNYYTAINNLNFFSSTPNYKILKILSFINDNPDITQSLLATYLNVAPSMINKYFKHLKKNGLIYYTGNNNKNTKYFLSEKGKNFQNTYKYNFINDIIKLYKTILNDIEQSLFLLQKKNINDFSILGINEFAEIVIEIIEKKKIDLVVKGLYDSDKIKHNTILYNHIIKPFDKFEPKETNNILITSLTHKNEIFEYLNKNYINNNLNIIIFADLLKERSVI